MNPSGVSELIITLMNFLLTYKESDFIIHCMIIQFEEFMEKGYCSGALYPVPKWISESYINIIPEINRFTKITKIIDGTVGVTNEFITAFTIANVWAEEIEGMYNEINIKTGHINAIYKDGAGEINSGTEAFCYYFGIDHNLIDLMLGTSRKPGTIISEHVINVCNWLESEESSLYIEIKFDEWKIKEGAGIVGMSLSYHQNVYMRSGFIVAKSLELYGVKLDISDVYKGMIDFDLNRLTR